MKALDHHPFLYNDTCPLCAAYTKNFMQHRRLQRSIGAPAWVNAGRILLDVVITLFLLR